MTREPPRYAWVDGKIVPWAEATVHVRTECVMRGSSVFEGIRAYWSEAGRQLFLFRPSDHIARLESSMKVMRMQMPFQSADLLNACAELLRRNEVQSDVHLRPTAYFGEGGLALYLPGEISTGVVITAVPTPSRLAVDKGIDCCISSWVRIADDSMPPRVKAGANYQNSRLAAVQARVDGYDNAILLSRDGKVAEATLATVFVVRDGIPVTPPVSSGILESITRATLMELLWAEMGLRVVEREIDRTELYVAEEVFLCGTGAEIIPVRSIDRLPVGDGSIGPLTQSLRTIYANVVRGALPKYATWLHPVYEVGVQ